MQKNCLAVLRKKTYMKIRTRFLLFLLPTLIGSITLISILFAYNWQKETVESFKARLKSAIITSSLFIEKNKNFDVQFEGLELEKELNIQNLNFLPLNSEKVKELPKTLHITPIYTKEKQKVMTGYKPIYDKESSLQGFISADINVNAIDQKFQESLYWILVVSSFTLVILISSLFMIANKISRPIQKLNSSALALAAGTYGESIETDGPKEVVELSNTLNIMSECLLENINRLKENALLRERMYGEYECSRLLQHLMLQKTIESSKSEKFTMRAMSFFSDNPTGLLLDFPKSLMKNEVQIRLSEAKEDGLEAMYELLTELKSRKRKNPSHFLILNHEKESLKNMGKNPVYLFSQKTKKVSELSQEMDVQSGDFCFLMNHGLFEFTKGSKNILKILQKVLNVFEAEGIDTVSRMLQKEISFLTKRKNIKADLHLICMQLVI